MPIADVVVVPMSGYVNRLQAVASALSLATQLGARLSIAWIPDAVAPAALSDVLDPEWADGHAVPSGLLAGHGIEPLAFPAYLHADERAITLAGFDRGEQAFMPALSRALADTPANLLVIRAGGHFSMLGESEEARVERADAYARLPLHPAVEAEAARARADHGRYLALHIRLTDRSVQAPGARALERALLERASTTGIDDVFIASDTARSRDAWLQRIERRGLHPWSMNVTSWDRSQGSSCHPALVDWRLLSGATAVIYSAASSFGEEATIAGRSWASSTGLSAGPARATAVRLRALGRAAVTYPARHGLIHR